jgi:hypothetical protein
VVAPPGALAEAPVARYEGVLKGLVWVRSGLYYGVVTPDREGFEIWEAEPSGARGPTLLWSCPYPELLLESVSPDGRYAWVGADLVDLESGELVRVAGAHTPASFSFFPDGSGWLYSYQSVANLDPRWTLALRPAGTPREEERVLLEEGRRIQILGWVDDVVALLVVGPEPELLLLRLAGPD